MPNEYYKPIGQGPAKKATNEDKIRDENGFTNPNLHRRANPKEPTALSGEVSPRDYEFSIANVNTFLTTQINTHDEDSEDSEIP